MNGDDKTQGQSGQIQNQHQPQVGGVGTIVKKEQEPVNSASKTESNVSQFLEPSGPERKLEADQELEKMGVKSVSEAPELDTHAHNAGIRYSGESVPVKTEPTGYAPIAMTEDVAKQTLKNAKPTDSIKWKAALIVKFFQKMHGRLLTGKN